MLFARDRSVVRPAAARRLRQVAAELRGRGPGRITVTGYTDDLGSAAYGRTLSRARAAAVGRVLRAELNPADVSFVLVGRGEADPAVPNTSEANRRINRRVVVLYEVR